MNVKPLSNTSIEKSKCKELKINIEEKLKPTSRCCIYRVPKDLCKISEETYTPQVISIGPLHHGKLKFNEMEKQKVRYKKDFGKRITKKKWEDLITFIKNNEQCIRNCYAETFQLKSHNFIIMILYDAIFIIELLLKYIYTGNQDFLLNKPRLEFGIRRDLQLLENQLPFFVLKKLYKLAIVSSSREVSPSFINLSCIFFTYGEFSKVANGKNLKHFVDLQRNFLVEILPTSKSKGCSENLPNAVKLHESGVKFKNSEPVHLLNIKFQKRKGCILFFKGNELQIPHITIEDGTECRLRNMMALEQCHYPDETHICNYIELMDSLINTEKDVDLLVEKGIITNRLGEHAAIARMFNKLCLQITLSISCYKDIRDNLKKHHRRWWNRTKATLMSVYFNNLWRGTATVAATILLVLTLLQTIYTMQS